MPLHIHSNWIEKERETVNSDQDFLLSLQIIHTYRRSNRMRRNSLYAIYGISLINATSSAKLKTAPGSILDASRHENLNNKQFS